MEHPNFLRLCLAFCLVAIAACATPMLTPVHVRTSDGAVVLDHAYNTLCATDFSQGMAGGWQTSNYTGRLTMGTRTFQGESAFLVQGAGSAGYDTAWQLRSTFFTVAGGSDFTLRIRLATTFDQLNVTAAFGGSYQTCIQWQDFSGKVKSFENFRFGFERCSTDWTDYVFRGTVPPGADHGQFYIGFDSPNINSGGWLAISEISIEQLDPENSYATSGSFVSLPYFTQDSATLSWEAECPPGCLLSFQTSTAPDVDGLPGAWSDWAPAGQGAAVELPEGHSWVRYQALLSGDGTATPILNSVRLGDRTESEWATGLAPTPGLVRLSPSPNPDTDAEIRFQVTDEPLVAWGTTRFLLDGADVTAQVAREGGLASYQPPAPLKPVGGRNLHELAIAGTDVLGRAFEASFDLLCAAPMTRNLTTLRDDGFVLIDGRPFFPIGIYEVSKLPFNDYSFDKAFADLKAVGFNLVHTHNFVESHELISEFLSAANKNGLKVWTWPGRNMTGDMRANVEFILRYKNNPALLAWYIGDDSRNYVPATAMRRNHELCHALDNAHLTAQADSMAGQNPSTYEAYVDSTDVFLPEIYPAQTGVPDNEVVPRVIRDMQTIRIDLARKGNPVKSIWAIIQYFDGIDKYRFPTFEQLRAMTYEAIIHGAHGVTWYHYASQTGRGHGVADSPEYWNNISSVTGELSALQERLCARRAADQPEVEVLEGPETDALGYASVNVLLKDNDAPTRLLLAANSSASTVRAAIRVRGCRQAEVLFENREIECGEDGIEDTFGPYAVHVYELAEDDVFQVTAEGAAADRTWAKQGRTVTLTAIPPSDYGDRDYEFVWSSTPEVEFAADGLSATFTMPAEAVAVTCTAVKLPCRIETDESCAADKETAAAGETVAVTALLPEGALVSDYDFTWSSVPAVQFAKNGGAATFTMPDANIAVSCAMTLKTYAVTATGATADRARAARGETVTLAAALPDGASASDYEISWSSVPSLQFMEGEGTASFEMPAEPVAVTCKMVKNPCSVTTEGDCVADRGIAYAGETVTLTPQLPAGALLADFTIRWSTTPQVILTAGGDATIGERQFVMPDTPVLATCTVAPKTYAVHTYNCLADKTSATRGETVTVTAIGDLDPQTAMIAWSLKPKLEYTNVDDTTIMFTMPSETVLVTANRRNRTFPVTAIGATANKSEAARGEIVALTAVLPLGASVADYDFVWNSESVVQFSEGEGAATFEMPSEAVNVTCVATLKTYAVTVAGCTADKGAAARGETVVLTAVLPEDASVSDCDFAWSSEPAVQFAEGEGTAIFEMPAEAVSVTCVATEKPLEDTATQRVLLLQPGWNLVVLSLVPDADSQAKLDEYSAMVLEPASSTYVHVREFTADGLYWLYTSKPARLVVNGAVAAEPLSPLATADWQPFGIYPAAPMDGCELWQWLDGAFLRLSEPQVVPGNGYFLRKK